MTQSNRNRHWLRLSALLLLLLIGYGTYRAVRPDPNLKKVRQLQQEFAAQADILRDLIGDPFAPSALDASWLQWNEGAVAKLARSIYTERAFERMPILADALPEAGCRDEAILDHCRAARPHHPGCWVLDLLLEQE